MSYSDETFNSFYSRMGMFEKLAAQNKYALKELLMKKVGVDEDLAEALIARWEAERPAAPAAAAAPVQPEAPGIPQDQFDAFLADMASFRRLAGLQGMPLKDWLMKNCSIDAATADKLIAVTGAQAPQKGPSLLDALAQPEPAPAPAPESPRPRPVKKEDDDILVTISRAPEESLQLVKAVIETHDVDIQIDMMHNLADSSQHKEPIQLILELKNLQLKKDYLLHPIPAEDRAAAERLLRDQEEQKKKILKAEQKLEQARQALATLKENPPKIFGREEHRKKVQDGEEEISRTERQIATLTAKEAERQPAYLNAMALLKKYAAAKNDIEARYRMDEEKFNAAKNVLIQSLHWSLLDIPDDVYFSTVLDRLSWYESFFKTFPEKIDLPVHGWLKAYNIVYKLTVDYPLWHREIDTIHFVVDTEMKSLKDAIRLFLEAFVKQLEEPYRGVCQLLVTGNEAQKTGSRKVQELVGQLAADMEKTHDDSVVQFCMQTLPFFYPMQALAEYLSFEVKIKNLFESPDPAGRGRAAKPLSREDYMRLFAEIAGASAQVLEVCFNASDTVTALWEQKAATEKVAACTAVIRANFENLFKSSRDRLQRY